MVFYIVYFLYNVFISYIYSINAILIKINDDIILFSSINYSLNTKLLIHSILSDIV